MSEWIVKKGNTSIQEIEINDKDGNPVENMADAIDIDFQIKIAKLDEESVIAKTKGAGIEVLTGDDLGKLRITLLPADTEIKVKKYFMGLQLRWDDITIYEVDLTIDGVETDVFRITQDMVEIEEE